MERVRVRVGSKRSQIISLHGPDLAEAGEAGREQGPAWSDAVQPWAQVESEGPGGAAVPPANNSHHEKTLQVLCFKIPFLCLLGFLLFQDILIVFL